MPAPGRNRLLLFQSGAIAYLLRATFGTAIAAPLPASLPVDVGGPLTVVDTGNKLSVSGGVLQIASNTAGDDPRLISTVSLTRVVGRALIGQIVCSASVSHVLNWSSASDGKTNTAGLFVPNTSVSALENGTVIANVAALVAGTVYDLLSVVRATGCFLFIKGGTFTTWTLIWVGNASSATPLYAAWRDSSGAGASTLDNFRVLDLGQYDARFATDYGLALNRSTFTAANGTALTAIVPEAGGAWTQQNASTWQITSNKMVVNVVGTGSLNLATVGSSSADGLVEVTANLSAVNTNAESGILLRFSDMNNYWLVDLIATTNTFAIYEKAAGVVTQRASSAFTVATATDYRIVAVAEGSTITAYVNNGTKITYASAASNQAIATHGILSFRTVQTFDDFIIWPRTITLRGDI